MTQWATVVFRTLRLPVLEGRAVVILPTVFHAYSLPAARCQLQQLTG